MEEQTPLKIKLGTLYILGLAPILAWPLCILVSMMSSSDKQASQEYLLFNVGLSFLYPLIPIVCVATSIIAAWASHPKLAYAAAWAPLAFYVVALMVTCVIYYIT
jgi:hypothetical protein